MEKEKRDFIIKNGIVFTIYLWVARSLYYGFHRIGGGINEYGSFNSKVFLQYLLSGFSVLWLLLISGFFYGLWLWKRSRGFLRGDRIYGRGSWDKLWVKMEREIIKKDLVVLGSEEEVLKKVRAIFDELKVGILRSSQHEILGIILYGEGYFKKFPAQYIRMRSQNQGGQVLVSVETFDGLCFSIKANRDSKINDLVGLISSKLV